MKKLKKVKWAVVSLGLIVLLVACSKPVQAQGNNEVPSVKKVKVEEGQKMKIKSFSFSSSSMAMEECFSYDLVKEDGKTSLTCNIMVPGQGFVDTVLEVDETALNEFEKLVNDYQLWEWDGFNKTESNILDGVSFSISFNTEDGESMYARGYMRFPENYKTVAPKIKAAFQKLVFDSRAVYPNTLESEELTTMYVHYRHDNQLFSFSVHQNSGNIKLNISANGYEDKLIGTHYYHGGTCESFPFEQVQKIVRKYDIPSLNGWTISDYESDNEYYDVEFGYESDEYIIISGNVPTKDHEAIKEDLINLLCDFINENGLNYYK